MESLNNLDLVREYKIRVKELIPIKNEYYLSQAYVFAYLGPLCVANLSVSTLRRPRV